jgi:ankyrin repeat protein
VLQPQVRCEDCWRLIALCPRDARAAAVPAGSIPLIIAAVRGRADAVALLLKAGASERATNCIGDTCLTAAGGNTGVIRQLLQGRAMPADDVQHAARMAADKQNWEAFVVLFKQLARQDRDSALALLTAMPEAAPALLSDWVHSNSEQRQKCYSSRRRRCHSSSWPCRICLLRLQACT